MKRWFPVLEYHGTPRAPEYACGMTESAVGGYVLYADHAAAPAAAERRIRHDLLTDVLRALTAADTHSRPEDATRGEIALPPAWLIRQAELWKERGYVFPETP